MTTMLDRAARALKDEIGKALDAKPLPFAGDTGNWSAKGDMQTLDLEACVRAVLMAVREPDEVEPVGASWLKEFGMPGSDAHLRASAGNAFTAMIDAILADGEGG